MGKVKKKKKLTHTPAEAKEELVTSLYLQISYTRSQRKSQPNSSMFLPVLIHTQWFPFAKTKDEAPVGLQRVQAILQTGFYTF